MDADHELCATYVDAESPLIKRAELIRLLCQSLRELGYPQISEELTRLSSYTCEARSITDLRTNVLEGNWLAAVSCLEESSLDCQLSSDQINQIKFILLRQYALETIATDGDYMAALDVMRNKIQPLGVCQDSLHTLAGCLICETQNEMKSVVHWDGPNVQGRQSTLRELQTFIPPDVMLPEGRLITLIKQALSAQRMHTACYDNVESELSLFADFRATPECLPTKCTQVLTGHCDQVWGATFSPDGSWVASAGLDGKLGLWKVDKEARSLAAHSSFPVAAGAVLTIVWTPDSRHVIAACETDDGSPRSSDVCIKICRISGGQDGTDARIMDVEMQAGPLRAMCCSTDGKYLYRIDTDQNLSIESLPLAESASAERFWQSFRPGKMLDIAASPNGRWLAVSFGHNVKIYSVMMMMSLNCSPDMANAVVATYMPQHSAMNVTFSSDSQYLLMDFKDRSLAVCQLKATHPGTHTDARALSGCVMTVSLTCEHLLRPPVAVAEEEGLKLRPSFGGRNGAFICQGSEKGYVLLWHWPTQTSLDRLTGHRQAVNTVTWSPVDPHMLVSASDDTTLRVWTSARTSG